MKNSKYLLLLFSCLCSINSCASEYNNKVSHKNGRPNVIVILADDMQIGATGYEGNPIIKTPNIDQLANDGTVFTKAFATSAVCTPSRTTLLTGLYERRHGVNFNSKSSLNEEAYGQTYPMLLKDSGYFVGYVGKNHTPIGKNSAGVTGYRSGVMDKSFDYWYAGHRHLTFYPKEIKRHAIFKNAKADTQIEIIEEGVDNFMLPNEAFKAGHNFLDSRPNNKPFALLINFNVPHASSTGSMELRDTDLELYKNTYREHLDSVSIPKTYLAANEITKPKLPLSVYNGQYIKSYNYVKNSKSLKERIIREIQTISGIDKLIGKLLANLKKQGVADNTIIIFTSDHGLMHGEFGLGGKVHLYDPSVRIPMTIFDPRIEPSTKVDRNSNLVALVDLAPTILELTDVPIPSEYQGHSLKPLMTKSTDGNTIWRQEIFLENMMTIQNYPRMEGVRTHDWKYIRYFDKKKDQDYAAMSVASINGEQPIYEELYDLANDPDEINNLISEPEHTKVVKRLREKNIQLVKEYRGDKPFKTHAN